VYNDKLSSIDSFDIEISIHPFDSHNLHMNQSECQENLYNDDDVAVDDDVYVNVDCQEKMMMLDFLMLFLVLIEKLSR